MAEPTIEQIEKAAKEASDKLKQDQEVHKKELNQKLDGFVPKSEFEAQSEKLETVEKAAREQGEEIITLKNKLEKGTPAASQSVADIFKAAVEADAEGFQHATREKNAKWFGFEHKAAGDITRATLPTTPSNFVPSQELRPGYIAYRTNEPIMLRYANVVRTTKGVINWVDETAGEGDAGWTAEGAAKPLMDVNVTVRTTTVKKVAVFSKVSEEALDDIDFLASLIEGRQKNKVALKVDQGLLTGDGTGENPTGLTYYAPAFTNTEMNDSVENPNYYDALGAAATQIRRANFEPNLVFINPVDWFKMMHTKDAEEQYVLLQLQLSNGQFLEMVAVQTNQAAVGTFYMGDFRYFNVAIREEMRTEMGLDGNDFRNNVVSMRTEMRVAAWVSENEKLAFVVDQYQDVIDAIAVA
jgi:HK97 family phage major capsid protein